MTVVAVGVSMAVTVGEGRSRERAECEGRRKGGSEKSFHSSISSPRNDGPTHFGTVRRPLAR